jgi:hypothetical protein
MYIGEKGAASLALNFRTRWRQRLASHLDLFTPLANNPHIQWVRICLEPRACLDVSENINISWFWRKWKDSQSSTLYLRVQATKLGGTPLAVPACGCKVIPSYLDLESSLLVSLFAYSLLVDQWFPVAGMQLGIGNIFWKTNTKMFLQ